VKVALKFVLLSSLFQVAWAAQESAQSFVFQGRLFDSSGTSALAEQATLKFDIYAPDGSCLLYSESQTVDVTHTGGSFAVNVGSGTSSPKRVTAPVSDPGLTMAQVFKNDPSTATRGCYTPTAGDIRKLRVTVTPFSTGIPEVLFPDQVIGSVGQSLVAETLQGLYPSAFVQKDVFISDVNLAKIFGSSSVVDASSLHHHDGRYILASSSSTQTIGAGGFTSLGVAAIGTGSQLSGATLSVQTASAAAPGLVIRSSASQTADLMQIQDSGGTKVGGFSSSGALTATGQLDLKYDATNKLSLGVSSTGVSTFTASGTAPKFNFTGGYIGVDTSSPATQLHVQSEASTSFRGVTAAQHSTDAAGPIINFRKSRNTAASPAAVANGDYTGFFANYGYNNGAYQGVGGLGFKVDGAVSAGVTPVSIEFATGTANATGPSGFGPTRMTISSGGNVGIGTSSPTAPLHVMTAGGSTMRLEGSTSYTPVIDLTTGTINTGMQLLRDTSLANFWALKTITTGDKLGIFVDNNSSKGLFISGGKIGIGHTSPVSKVDVIDGAFNALWSTRTLAQADNTATGLGGQFGSLFGGDVHMRSFWGVSIDLNNGSLGDSASATQARIPSTSSFSVNSRSSSTAFTNLFTVRNSGNVGIGGVTAPASKLEVKGVVGVNDGTKYALSNNTLASGALSIGSISQSYGGGATWSANTAGLIMETLSDTEIVVHDYNDNLHSLGYFTGAQGTPANTYTMGRNIGYGILPKMSIMANNFGIGTNTPVLDSML